jgi:aspartokinase
MDKNPTNLQLIAELHLEQANTTHYMAHISWEREIAIVYDEKLAANIESKIPNERIKLKLDNLALIGIFLEESNINDIWIIYTLTKKLNFNNINMIEIISNYTEVSFIVERENLSKSIEVLIN